MTDITITDGDKGKNIVTTPDSPSFQFHVELMGGRPIGKNTWVLPKDRRPRLEDLLRNEFGRIGPPVKMGAYLVPHTNMDIQPEFALLAGDKIAGLKDTRAGGVWLSDDVIPAHRATCGVREHNGRAELALVGDFIVFGVSVDWAREHNLWPLGIDVAIEMAINSMKDTFAQSLVQLGEQRMKHR